MQEEENGEKHKTNHYTTNRPYFYTCFDDKKFVILALYLMWSIDQIAY